MDMGGPDTKCSDELMDRQMDGITDGQTHRGNVNTCCYFTAKK